MSGEPISVREFDVRLRGITDAFIARAKEAQEQFEASLEMLVEDAEASPDISDDYQKFAVAKAVKRVEQEVDQ